MKNALLGLFLVLSAGAVAAQNAPTATFQQAFAAGQAAEESEHWEQAEVSYAICLVQAPADTTALKNHAYAATNSLSRHTRKPDSAAQPDYLPLAVKDYDALVAAGRVRYLLDKALAYGTRAEASDPAEATQLVSQALAAVGEYEQRGKPDVHSKEVRKALQAIRK
ncbi:hypothetical protein QMK33_00370 [Hymenobacter sp. H14-R3]|uniref:hypothetical protein n=1 Tax=Hymenobacter sp. H14-R3 TaxID=3046308 RepID=UPI0024B8D14E|nr:hypothetical protein [Hymenobacter sp. H14-R3]MDJ0363588.1 hypothetical protein [Hymenobacter sp. H14-R3]